MIKEKLLKATHEGKIQIGENELNCAVLEDGTRIISASAIFKAFGRTKRGRAKNEIRVPNMPSFIDANNLQPFIKEDLRGVLQQHSYLGLNKKEDSGYSALILPMLCKVYLDAREDKKLNEIIDELNAYNVPIHVVIEAGWLINKSNWHTAQGQFRRERIAKNVGENHDIGKIIEQFCKHLNISYELQKPKGKLNQEIFENMTKIIKRTNQEQRDAAILVFGI